MIPSFKPGILSSNKIRAAANDVTPNAVNWVNIDNQTSTRFTTQQISGISTSITLEITFTGSNPGTRLGYKVETAGSTPSYTTGTLTGNGFTVISAYPTSFSVSNNQYVSFGINTALARGNSATITVKNTTDSSATLDTFLLSW